MKKGLFLILCLVYLTAGAQTPAVLEVEIHGTIDLGVAYHLERAIRVAEQDNAILLMDIDTFGGRVDAAARMSKALLESPVHSIAFIHNKAISAGALIAISAEKIYGTDHCTFGDVQPKPTNPKTVSYVRAAMKSAAESRGRNPIFAEAMVEKKVALYRQPDSSVTTVTTDQIYVSDAEILTLTAGDALDFAYLDGIVADKDEILYREELETTEIRTFRARAAELLVRLITHPMVSSFLLMFALFGIYMEIRTPGFGFPGILGFSGLVLFFFGHYIAGLAGWEEVILLGIGTLLLLLEILVIPGFGVAGIMGILCLGSGVVLSFLSNSPQSPFFWTELAEKMNYIGLALLLFVLFLVLVLIRFFHSKYAQKLVLEKDLHTSSAHSELDLSIGEQGIALAPLHPTGMARFGEKRFEVMAYSDFIEKDQSIEVKEIKGNRIFVEVKK